MTTSNAEDLPPLRLDSLAFALLAPDDGAEHIEASWLRSHRGAAIETGHDPAELLTAWIRNPHPADLRLHAIAAHLRLTPVEALAVALARAVETDALAGRAIAYLQQPTGGSRPTVGLVLAAASSFDTARPALLSALADGAARRAGLLLLDAESGVLPDATISVPVPVALALEGVRSCWPGIRTGVVDPVALPQSAREEAVRWAVALKSRAAALVIRARDDGEGAAAALLIAGEIGLEPAFVDGEPPPGIGPWLHLTSRIPVFVAQAGPGERNSVPAVPGYHGPVIVAAGLDGGWERADEPIPAWRLDMPMPDERVALWRAALGDEEAAEILGRQYRHGPGRISGLSRAARTQAARDGGAATSLAHVLRAGREGAAADLGPLAQPLPEAIGDEALVLSASLREEMEALVARCVGRDALADDLGPAVRARFHPGVRALLHGPSGTGKTLAAGWLATRLGLPLYRVDLATVTSKYIGETEKNLAQLFARAENAEVVLLFDEADALFGKRTEVRDSNDRYANAQTNYLLQRMESFDGIAILASNGRSRFDAAFARRLDVIIEFPLPSPEERRALWLAHLGDGHRLSAAEVNRLAAGCDLAGGHIRNAVLAAASRARSRGTSIELGDVIHGIAVEYRKLGRQMPADLGGLERITSDAVHRPPLPGARITF